MACKHTSILVQSFTVKTKAAVGATALKKAENTLFGIAKKHASFKALKGEQQYADETVINAVIYAADMLGGLGRHVNMYI